MLNTRCYAHLNDDFHRFVQYIKAGFPFTDLKKKPFKTLRMTLFEISLPEVFDEGDKQKSLKEIVSSVKSNFTLECYPFMTQK